uniref:Uncharacterized protein n=1 Tax=Arundo donax TaxID=35708 RepID=A0A0A9B8K3_ARUDO
MLVYSPPFPHPLHLLLHLSLWEMVLYFLSQPLDHIFFPYRIVILLLIMFWCHPTLLRI